jgi:hypothetical protein
MQHSRRSTSRQPLAASLSSSRAWLDGVPLSLLAPGLGAYVPSDAAWDWELLGGGCRLVQLINGDLLQLSTECTSECTSECTARQL